MVSKNRFLLSAICFVTVLSIGCTNGDGEYRELDENDNVTNTAPPEDHHHDAGPHGGHVLEFGEYHGEITFADGIITVYVLEQSDLNAAAPVADASVTLNLKVGEETKAVQLTASPQAEDADGEASKFVSPKEEVPESITDIEDIHGSVVLTFGEKELTAKITHDHAH